MTNATLAIAASNLVLLSADELAFINANRANGFVPDAVLPVEKPLSKGATFLDKIEALGDVNLNRSRGVYPAMVVNTSRGKRGIFWAGVKNGTLRVGTCKMTEIGRLHKPNKFDGRWFQDATDLLPYNS